MVDIGRRRRRFDVTAAASDATTHSHICTALIRGRGTAATRMTSDVLLTARAWTTHTGRLMLLRFGTVRRLFNIRCLVFTIRDGDHGRWRRSIVDCDRLRLAMMTAVAAVVYVTSTATAAMMVTVAARSMVYASAVHHHAAAASSIATATVRRRRMVNLYIVGSAQAASTATHRSGIDLLIVVVMVMVSTATAGLLRLYLLLL